MRQILYILFPATPCGAGTSRLLLAARIVFGILLMTHGIAKWQQFDTLSAVFPDPLGVGSHTSLLLAIFGEVICSVGFITGTLYRLALLPMIFTLGVAFFSIHRGDPFAQREMALLYLAAFVLLWIAGPGTYAVDRLIARKLRTEKTPQP